MDTYNKNNAIDFIWLAQILVIIAFFALLIMAIILISNFYIADNGNCKSFTDAAEAGEPGSKEHTIALTNSLLCDGIWPVAYIAAAISTGFIILGLGIPATIQNIVIIFLFTFIPYYAMILFIYHHYVQFVKETITQYIVNSTPNNIEIIKDNPIDTKIIKDNPIINEINHEGSKITDKQKFE